MYQETDVQFGNRHKPASCIVRALRVLVVEDDAIIGELLGEMLDGMGHNVCGIESTEAGAIVAAALHHPDLMIVDANLRIGTGLAAMRQILLAGPQAHLFIGGSPIQTLNARSVVLKKPFGERELVEAIDRVFEPIAT